jgi:hypothetical protein
MPRTCGRGMLLVFTRDMSTTRRTEAAPLGTPRRLGEQAPVGARTGAQDGSGPQSRPRRLPPWASRAAAVVAALGVGFMITLGLFVSLPALGGMTRFDLRRRHQELRSSREMESFQVFGPVRVTPQSVAFSWVTPGDSLFRSYEVHYSTQPGFALSAGTLFETPITEPSATSVEVTGLECATTYYFRIRLNDRTGRAHDSQEIATRTEACPDTSDPMLLAGSYDRDVREDPSSWDDPLYTSAEDTGSAGAAGDEWLRAGTEAGDSLDPVVARESGSAAAGPSSKPGVHVYPPTGISTTSAEIFWTEDRGDDFSAYEIHVGRWPGFRPSTLTLRQAPVHSAYRSRATLSGLDCNTVYFVIVRTRRADGSYSDSNGERLTTLPCGESRSSPTSQGP